MPFARSPFRKLLALASAPGRTMGKLEQKAGDLEAICDEGLHQTTLVSNDALGPLTMEVPIAECLERVLEQMRSTSLPEDVGPEGTGIGRPIRVPDAHRLQSKRLEGHGKRAQKFSRSIPPSRRLGRLGFSSPSQVEADLLGSSQVNIPETTPRQIRVPEEADGRIERRAKQASIPESFDATKRDQTLFVRDNGQRERPRGSDLRNAKRKRERISSTKAILMLKKRTASSPAHSGWDRPVRIEEGAVDVPETGRSNDEMLKVPFEQLMPGTVSRNKAGEGFVPYQRTERDSGLEPGDEKLRRFHVAESPPAHHSRQLKLRPLYQEGGSVHAFPQNNAAKTNRNDYSQHDQAHPSSTHSPNLSTPTGLRGLAAKFAQSVTATEPQPGAEPLAPPVPKVLADQREETLLEERLNRVLLRAARRQGIDLEDLDR
ncbi:MAG: hypothetical protein GY847_09085 [Proteobacteria bacterium]|nr:hypothetical protein [Pseudomonadota bacterium]